MVVVVTNNPGSKDMAQSYSEFESIPFIQVSEKGKDVGNRIIATWIPSNILLF